MLLIIKIAISLIISYLIGSIPTAYIFAKILKGVDIREFGSGNVGATNAFRLLGKKIGICILILDILKGFIVVILVGDYFITKQGVYIFSETVYLISLGIAAICGHNWTIFLKGKGGKGMATTLGVLSGLCIKISGLGIVLLLAISIWLIIFLTSGFVSLASVLSAVSFPLFVLLLGRSLELLIMGIILAVFIILRHRPNIHRLLNNQEPKIKLWHKP